MKLKYSVEVPQHKIDALFNVASTACLATYDSIEEQNAAVAIAKKSFSKLLCDYVDEAFKLSCEHKKEA